MTTRRKRMHLFFHDCVLLLGLHLNPTGSLLCRVEKLTNCDIVRYSRGDATQQCTTFNQYKLIYIHYDFLGPRGPLVEPSNFPSRPSVRKKFSRVHIYRHTCLMNHQKSHQTNPMAQREPIDAPLTPWDPVGLPLDPLGPCRPTP